MSSPEEANQKYPRNHGDYPHNKYDEKERRNADNASLSLDLGNFTFGEGLPDQLLGSSNFKGNSLAL